MPELYIITGSNGAGKSSIGFNYLPEFIQKNYPIFDGDKLFMQKQKELWNSGIKFFTPFLLSSCLPGLQRT